MVSGPLVTVCIPNYNNAKYVGEAISSALNQTYKNIEVVVVDNCSTDNSWDIISSISHAKLRVFRNKFNIGMYPNFMKAAEFANGEFIKFICADDWLDSNYISRSLELFTQFDIALVTSIQAKFSEERKKILGYRNIPNGVSHIAAPADLYRYFLLHTNPIGNPTKVLIRKSVFEEFNGFDMNFNYCNDYELWMRVSKKYSVAFINECLSFERKHENQFTSTYNISGEDIKNVVFAWNKNFGSRSKEDLETLLRNALFPFYMTAYRLSKANKNMYLLHNVLYYFSDLGMTSGMRKRLNVLAFFKYNLEIIKKKFADTRNSIKQGIFK